MSVWMLAQIKPNADGIAKRNLERQGFATFQPLERTTAVRRGRFVTLIRSFFPGYLFVNHASQHAPWSLINSTYGVARLVKFGDRPAHVPDELILDLRRACDEDGAIMVRPELAQGTTVEIQTGAFANFMGTVERLAPKDRALVLIDFMGAQSRVTLPVGHLRVASDTSR